MIICNCLVIFICNHWHLTWIICNFPYCVFCASEEQNTPIRWHARNISLFWLLHFFLLIPKISGSASDPGPRSQVTGHVSLWRFLCVWPPFFVFGRLCVLRNVVFNVGACYRQILCHSWVSYLKDKNAARGRLIHRRVKAGSSQKRTFDDEDV